MQNEKTQNEEKILLSFQKKIKIHLTLRDGSFRNGFVKELKSDFFMFDDTINGIEPIFFLELKNVEPYMEERK